MNKKGFTIIEIMIVVGIMVLLVAVVIVAGNKARAVARDNQRVSDIAIIRLKLESYRDQNGYYPAKLDTLVSGSPKYMNVNLLKDPTGASYDYRGVSVGTTEGKCASYHLWVKLEEKNSSLKKAARQAKRIACTGSSVDVGATDDPMTSLIYDQVSPDIFKSN